MAISSYDQDVSSDAIPGSIIFIMNILNIFNGQGWVGCHYENSVTIFIIFRNILPSPIYVYNLY